MDYTAVIIFDDRERNVDIDNMEDVLLADNTRNRKLAYLGGGGDIIYQVNRCEIGDYIISIPSNNNPEHYITAIVIERKTWKDLAASLLDKRCNSQHIKMTTLSRQTGCLVYYIIEGVEPKSGRIPLKNLWAKLRQNCIRGAPVFRSKNKHGTANLLTSLTRDLLKLYRKGEITFPLQEPRDNSYDPDDFTMLLDKYSGTLLEQDIIDLMQKVEILNTEWQVSTPLNSALTQRQTKSEDEIMLSMWRAFTGVGPETASLLSRHFTVRQIFVAPPTLEEIKSLRYNTGGKISQTTIKKIIKSVDDNLTHIRILSQIPGITKSVARLVLAYVPMRDLWTGECDAESLKLIKTKKDSKTMKIGNRINKILSITCPEYVQPIPPLAPESSLYKILKLFGDPQELRFYIENLSICNGDAIEFDAFDEEYDYPPPIQLGHNEFTFASLE